MAASIRLSELNFVTTLDNEDLLLLTDAESATSRKLKIGDLKANIFSGDSFAAFADVDITSVPPTDGQFLRYNEVDGNWQPGDISLSSLGELQDVDLLTNPPTENQLLIWQTDKFVPGTIDLTPLYTLLGVNVGDVDLGDFTSQLLDDDSNVRSSLAKLAQELAIEVQARTQSTSAMTLTIENNEEAILNGDTRLNNLDTTTATTTSNLSTLQNTYNTFSAATTTEQATQDNRLTALETSITNLDIGIAPETLNSINELAQALGDDADFLQTVNQNITSNTTDISAIENILYKLVPEPPTTLAGMSLTVNTNGGTRRLCTGFTDRTGGTSGYQAGDQIKRNTDGSITTNKISDIGPGDSGEIEVKISENSYGVSTTMATGTQVVDFQGLKITDNKDASQSTRDTGIPAGFYQTYDIQLVDAALQNETNGLHYVQYSHAGAQTQKAYFYEDESNPGSPTLITSSIYLPTSPNYNYSSGIPHYSNSVDNDFSYSLIAQNLSGEMYIQNQLASSSQTTGFSHEGNKNYTDFGDGTNPPAPNFGVGVNKIASVSQYPRDLHTSVSSNQFSNWTITTPYGSVSKRPSTNLTYNIMGGTARTDVIDEDNIAVSISAGANATRVGDVTGDNPTTNPQDWVPLATPAAHEAIVVGGVLKHDRTDYSDGYRPVGPDLSSRSVDPQYAEFDIRRSAVSQFTINYTGSASGCWVSMPNNTAWQNSLSGTNGWADMFQSYRGSGVPTSAEPGCSSGGVMDNDGGSFTCVFGTESSSNDSENRILVRWKLSEGQQITSMSFSG